MRIIFLSCQEKGGGVESCFRQLSLAASLRCDAVEFRYLIVSGERGSTRWLTVLKNMVEIIRHMVENGETVLVSALLLPNVFSLFLAGIFRGRIVFSVHNNVSENYASLSGLKKIFFLLVCRLGFKNAPCWFVSQDLLAAFESEFGCAKRAFVVYNACLPLPDAVPLGITHTDLLFVGRITPQKRIDKLILVLEKLPNVVLRIVGDGPEKQSLHRVAQEAGVADRIIWTSFVDNIQDYYLSADCLVLTSDYEGFGMVLIEALSSGLPVVATDAPYGPREIADIVHRERISLVDIDDLDGFARNVQLAISAKVRYCPLGLHNFHRDQVLNRIIKKVENHDW